MKKYLLWAVIPAMIGFGLVHCGGDSGGSTKAPSADSFENPDGAVTEANATEVQNDALDASQTGGTFDALSGLTKTGAREKMVRALAREKARLLAKTRQQTAACYDGADDGSEYTIDLDCFEEEYGGIDGCDLGGSFSYSCDSEFDSDTFECGGDYSSQYDGFSIDCGDGAISCDGVMSGTTTSEGEINCFDITCSFDGEEYTEDSCYFGASILVDAEGGSVVCLSITPNDDCTQITSEFEDAEGPLTITCDVTDPAGGCSDVSEINEVENCAITR